MSRPTLLVRLSSAAVVSAALVGASLGAVPSGSAPAAAEAAVCPPGYRPLGRVLGTHGDQPAGAEVLAQTLDAQTTGAQAGAAGCVSLKHPESAAELSRAAREASAKRTAPFDTVHPGAYNAALAQRSALAAAAPVPGTAGTWKPVGTGPLFQDDAEYGSVNGLGLAEVAGRIQDFAFDVERDVVYASVAQGGVYKSLDRGLSWIDVSKTLPNLTVASVAYSPVNGGTLVVVTGDSNGGGNSVVGNGGYWSNNGGLKWNKSAGLPEGVLGFRVAVDPTNPSEVYAATGAGLFRSVDAGRTYVNVELPTGDCAGQPAVHPCFFANQVTDVVVQTPDDFGNDGGRVVAAVGWRAGAKADREGNPQAPGNGLYGSEDGAPGSFERLDQPGDGFAPQATIGRVEFGAATGADQNSDYLYAIVQDAVKFNGGVPVTDANEASAPVIGYNNALNGIYVSSDFGDTWVLMQDGEDLSQSAAAGGSALGGTAQALGVGPGVQAWYNEWIKPDPTRTDPTTNAPTRLLFGLEEIWQNEITTVPQVGPSRFKVIGRYFSGDTCFFLGLPGLPYCPVNRGEPQGSLTTHPDQHGALFIPGEDEGSVTLLVGNDGGVYRQDAAAGEEFVNTDWGRGNQAGFHTLLPYSVAVAKDGVVWSGLQDNGHMKIDKTGRQIATYGGDGTWALVDPEDSDVAYEATPAGAMNVTTDGGRNWSSIDPVLTGANFVNQFEMDPKDSAHLVTAGREIKEKLDAPATSEWTTVFDLGTVDNPGVAPGTTDMAQANRMSSIDVNGNAVYVAFCGACDVVTQAGEFKNGIATNVGGDEAPEAGTASGWHIVETSGLPNRYITGVTIDPDDDETVYVTLGGYGRRWVPPGANGDSAENVGEGHVYKSSDAGKTWRDVSANLPDIPASWLIVRGSQLLVATDFGVFASTTREGGRYGLLGKEFDLPFAPVNHMVLKPGDPNTLLVANYGRGVYQYTFASAPAGPVTKPPVVRPIVKPKPPGKPLVATGGAFAAAATAAAAGLGVLALRRRRRLVA